MGSRGRSGKRCLWILPQLFVKIAKFLDAGAWDTCSTRTRCHECAAVSLLSQGIVRYLVTLVKSYTLFRFFGLGFTLLAFLYGLENPV